MHNQIACENVKSIEAQQAKLCNNYKKTKLKLLKTNGAMSSIKRAQLTISTLIVHQLDKNKRLESVQISTEFLCVWIILSSGLL